MSGIRQRLTYANVMVTVLAFIVLGGTALAIGKNSIGSKQLKANAVHTADLADHAVTSDKLAPKALAGNATVRSETGTVPLTCTESNFSPTSYTLLCSGRKSFTASCSSGEHATGGGYTPTLQPTPAPPAGTPTASTSALESRPEPTTGTPTGWYVNAGGFGSNSGSSAGVPHPADPPITVYVVCSA
jgi:hypothetical protein